MAPSPTFSLYRLLTGVLGGRYVPVPLGPRSSSSTWTASWRRRCRSGPGSSCSTRPTIPPARRCPTGRWSGSSAETDALVLCDEAYQDFGGPTAIPLLQRTLAAGGAAHLLQGDGHGGPPLRARAGAPRGGPRAGQGQAALQREPGDPRRRGRRAGSRRRCSPRAPGHRRDARPVLSAPLGEPAGAHGLSRPRPTSCCSAAGPGPPPRCSGGSTTSTASWCATSPAVPSWPNVSGSRSGPRRTWTRC